MKLKFLINLVFISIFGFSSLMLTAADEDEEEDRDRGGIEEITVTAENVFQLCLILQCLLLRLIPA